MEARTPPLALTVTQYNTIRRLWGCGISKLFPIPWGSPETTPTKGTSTNCVRCFWTSLYPLQINYVWISITFKPLTFQKVHILQNNFTVHFDIGYEIHFTSSMQVRLQRSVIHRLPFWLNRSLFIIIINFYSFIAWKKFTFLSKWSIFIHLYSHPQYFTHTNVQNPDPIAQVSIHGPIELPPQHQCLLANEVVSQSFAKIAST